MLSVGDIIGHDIQAAAVMGQVRSMLRQASLDHATHSPAAALDAVDRAFDVLPWGPAPPRCTPASTRTAAGGV